MSSGHPQPLLSLKRIPRCDLLPGAVEDLFHVAARTRPRIRETTMVLHRQDRIMANLIVPQPIDISELTWQWQMSEQQVDKYEQMPDGVAATSHSQGICNGRESIFSGGTIEANGVWQKDRV